MTQNNKITLYISSVKGQAKNTSYPFRAEIASVEDLQKAAAFDNVGAEYADGKNNRGRLIKGYRSKRTFRKADCLPADCDNTQPNPLLPDLSPEQWKTPADVQAAFPDVPFYVVYSRNHMKEKDGKPPRPKFHVYFIMGECADERAYFKLKIRVREHFPAFDPKAADTAHFFFGVDNPQVEFYGGDTPIDVFFAKLDTLPAVIPVGERNSTLSRYAAKILKKFGDSERALQAFHEAADKCEAPLEDAELETIWHSAKGFFHGTIEKDPDYIAPDTFAAMDFEGGGKKKPITSGDIKAILEKLNIQVRLNVLSGMVEIDGLPPQFSKSNAANVLPVYLMDYIKAHKMKCTRQALDDCLVLIEDENRFNPVRDMLDSAKYDGVDRIAELLEILGVAGNERESLYVRKWLHQGVALALNDENEPYGADGVLVIQDDQGAGKTLFCSTLAVNPDWFAEGVSIDLDKKDTIIQSTSCWIAELGELDSTLKREQSALKAFLTASRDTYRQPYARAATRKPRRTNFCATVNPQEFLNDETGSRRFWVVHPAHIDVERIKGLSKEWLAQLWRQVYEQFYLKDPQGFRLTQREREALTACNERYTKPLPGEIEIMDNLDFDAPLKAWKWVKVSEVLNGLGIRGVSTAHMGKVLAKLARNDERIQVKNAHNVKRYLLPPKAVTCFYPYSDDGEPPVLAQN